MIAQGRQPGFENPPIKYTLKGLHKMQNLLKSTVLRLRTGLLTGPSSGISQKIIYPNETFVYTPLPPLKGGFFTPFSDDTPPLRSDDIPPLRGGRGV